MHALPRRRIPFLAALAFVGLFLLSPQAIAAGDKKAKAATGPRPAAMSAPLKGTLVWRGDITTARAFMFDLAKDYEREARVRIEVNPFSTLAGLDAVTTGTADFAGSARPAHAKRPEEGGLRFIPVAYDALVLITYPGNPVGSVTLKDVWRLYYGKATNWKELGGRDAAVNMYAVAGPLDGVEYSLRSLLFENGDQRVAAPRLYLNASKLEEAITLDPVGFGVTTLSGISGNTKVKVLGVEGVMPSLANIGDGSYPLYTPLYLVVREDAPQAGKVMEFVAWLDGPTARNTLRRHQLLPYGEGSALATRETERLAMIETKVNATPVAAPSATVESLVRSAPTSPRTAAAKEREAEARARQAASNKAEQATKDGHE